MPVLEPLEAVRVAATPAALDAMDAHDALVLRTAHDEALVIGASDIEVSDEHAIVLPDTSWLGARIDNKTANRFLRQACEFDLPDNRPALAQGMVAALAVKMWLEDDHVLFVVPMAVAADFEDRFTRLAGDHA